MPDEKAEEKKRIASLRRKILADNIQAGEKAAMLAIVDMYEKFALGEGK